MPAHLPHHYPESRFGGFTDLDGTLTFFTRVNALLTSTSVVLDVGCGRGEYLEDAVPIRRATRTLRGKCARVIGVDVDPIGKTNQALDEFRLLTLGERWPIDDSSTDLLLCDHILEHVAQPEQFFSECRRVIKPGGYICIRTPNRLNYIALIAQIIPNKYHARVLAKAQEDRHEEDVFPTLYRCNTRGTLRRLLTTHGFTNVVYGYEAEPTYLSFSRICYALGVLHQRLAPNACKAALFAFGQKHI
ncbi:class I SAM-dependent methyltransferase [Candidatus Uhrbacteria bacterium]|nr:class I SAM-dependent methyltransferase [Candidatus Uhrbacteria bacterium]